MRQPLLALSIEEGSVVPDVQNSPQTAFLRVTRGQIADRTFGVGANTAVVESSKTPNAAESSYVARVSEATARGLRSSTW